MGTTKRIEPDRIAAYFDQFTKRFLADSATDRVDIEVQEPELGNQFAEEGARLLGITYDRGSNALEIALETGDHRTYAPKEVWAVEEPDGFVSAVEVVRADGVREIVNVRRGAQRQDETTP